LVLRHEASAEAVEGALAVVDSEPDAAAWRCCKLHAGTLEAASTSQNPQRGGTFEVKSTLAVLALASSALLLAACGGVQDPTAAEPTAAAVVAVPVTAADSAALTLEQLGDATYQGIYAEPITLTNGVYEGPLSKEGGATRPTVTLIPEPVGSGDLNGDDQADAAVTLAENSGGSGTFIYLAAVLDRNGEPENVATTLLGDRVQVQSIAIEDARIVVEGLSFAPDDPMCCPTQETVWTFELQGTELVEVTGTG
jgi:hypothetical protein